MLIGHPRSSRSAKVADVGSPFGSHSRNTQSPVSATCIPLVSGAPDAERDARSAEVPALLASRRQDVEWVQEKEHQLDGSCGIARQVAAGRMISIIEPKAPAGPYV
jgi:hypothetical protein